MKKKPTFSIIIPVLKVNAFIKKYNLPALAKQTIDSFEVIVLPNKATKWDKRLQKKYPFLKIIETPNISHPSQKRNLGVSQARGKYLVFIDDDAYPEPDWLEAARYHLKKQKVMSICGPGMLPKEAKPWEKAFDALLCTWLGSGGLSYRFQKEKPRFVDDFPTMNFFILKSAFNKLNGFDVKYWPGEDSKLCNDLIKILGGSIYYHPSIQVYHFRRNSLRKFLHQHAQYGEHRGAFFAQGDTNSLRWWYLVPSLFVVYLATLLLMISSTYLGVTKISSYYLAIFSVPLLLYLILISDLIYQIIFKSGEITTAFRSAVVLFLMHLTYGVAFLKGFFTGKSGYSQRKI